MTDSLVSRHAERVLRSLVDAGAEGADPVHGTARARWRRCLHDLHLDPAHVPDAVAIDPRRLKESRSRNAELLAVAEPEMEWLRAQIDGSGYALLLADSSGVVLASRLDPGLQEPFDAAGLVPGADWSERRQGTNGIGTCVAEIRAVTVHRAEHFAARHAELSCTGVPVRDARGRLLAVLAACTVSSRDTRASQLHTMALLHASAANIEKQLFLRGHGKGRLLRFHARAECVGLAHDGILALSSDDTVEAADAAALRLLKVDDRDDLVGRPLSDVFELGKAGAAGKPCRLDNVPTPVRDLRRGHVFFVALDGAAHDTAKMGTPPVPQPPCTSQRAGAMAPWAAAVGLSIEQIAGEDVQMLRNVRVAQRIAASDVPVLIQGPTGSGKEVFARAIHQASTRAAQAFIAVNCAAIPENLIESELFGYRPGAFTGARKDGMKGRILQSSGGTLFLDEIGDMPLLLQTRLLRVLEEQEIVPLGADVPVRVDLRVICASHRKLRAMIERGEFREDLYYRLNGVTLELPSLCERTDREQIIERVLRTEAPDAVLSPGALAYLLAHDWPGNIRELRNTLRTAAAIREGRSILPGDLPDSLRRQPRTTATAPAAPATTTSPPAAPPMTPRARLADAERRILLDTMEHHRWNMTHVATHLQVSRNTLYRKIKHHGIAVGRAR